MTVTASHEPSGRRVGTGSMAPFLGGGKEKKKVKQEQQQIQEGRGAEGFTVHPRPKTLLQAEIGVILQLRAHVANSEEATADGVGDSGVGWLLHTTCEYDEEGEGVAWEGDVRGWAQRSYEIVVDPLRLVAESVWVSRRAVLQTDHDGEAGGVMALSSKKAVGAQGKGSGVDELLHASAASIPRLA